jgi:hypothetical protein
MKKILFGHWAVGTPLPRKYRAVTPTSKKRKG